MKRRFIAVIFVLLIFVTASCGTSSIKTPKVSGGKVEGVSIDEITMFKGIPFAAPPVDNLRWKAPQPVVPWKGVLKTEEYGCGCIQDEAMAKTMGVTTDLSEDCLFLNVWTPAKSNKDKLAVIVWIHGGGFTSGTTSIPMYDGINFAKKGVVFVSITHRLGPFGFLAHPELSKESGKGSGNYGLMDMIAGLEWVKENINKFGGDSSRVTLFGHSAGSMAVSMLAASPQAKGLFHGVIAMSGASFAPSRFADEAGQNVATLKRAESAGVEFIDQLGVNNIKAARNLSADKIQKSLEDFKMSSRFWPVDDGFTLPGDQYVLYSQGNFNDTPLLIGSTSDEAGTFNPDKITAAKFIEQIKKDYGHAAGSILKAYPHSTDEDASRSSKFIMRDTTFAWPAWTWAKLQAKKGKDNAYVYYFDYHKPETPDGAGHGTDVSYAFQTLGGTDDPPAKEDIAISDMISSYYINFAKTGDPNGPDMLKWPAFTEKDKKVMVLDQNSSARPIPNLEILKAFDEYYAWRREEVKKISGK